MSDNAPSLPQTTDAGGAVSTAVSNKAVLELTEDETNTMYDYAALAKDNSVSPDLPEYIMETDNVRVALRKARDLGMGDKDWMDVIKMLEEKEKEAKK